MINVKVQKDDLKIGLSESLAKKIFGNSQNAFRYLCRLDQIKKIKEITSRVLKSGPNKGKNVYGMPRDVWKLVVGNWNYESGKKIVRELFRESLKYKRGMEAEKEWLALVKEWEIEKLGEIKWPISQGKFDEFVQSVNSGSTEGSTKDLKVREAAVKYRRIKEINTVRNDFIETLIFEKNENLIPTLNHSRNVDFFIDGVSFDQKVAKSPTKEFKDKYKENWRQQALDNPALVAEYLYTYQDEGRFGEGPRLYIVYLDEKMTPDQIRDIINKTDLKNPLQISFTYRHKNQGEINYRTSCFVILLHS